MPRDAEVLLGAKTVVICEAAWTEASWRENKEINRQELTMEDLRADGREISGNQARDIGGV